MDARLSGCKKSDKARVRDRKTDFEGSGHLLILADSAQLVMESKGLNHDGGNEVSDGVFRMRREENRSCCDGKTPRLSQVRRQARSGSSPVVVLDQGRRMRLTQVKRLARSRCHSELQRYESCTNGPARVTRPSKLGREARTGSSCLVRQGVEEVADKQLDQKISEAENRRRETIIAEIFGEGEGPPRDGDCRERRDTEKGAARSDLPMKGEADGNVAASARGTTMRRASGLRPRARDRDQDRKGRQVYTPSGLLLAMLRRS